MSYQRSLKAEAVPTLKKCSVVLTRIEIDNYTMRTSARHHYVKVHTDTDSKTVISHAQSIQISTEDQKKIDFPNNTALQKMSRYSKSSLSVDGDMPRMQSADTLSLVSLSLSENVVARSPTNGVLQPQSKTLNMVDKDMKIIVNTTCYSGPSAYTFQISHCQCPRSAMIEFHQQLNSTSCSESSRNALANSSNNICIMPLRCGEQTVSYKPYNLIQKNLECDFNVPKKCDVSRDKICINNNEYDVEVDEEFKTPKNPSTGLTNKTVIDSGTWTTYDTSYVVSEIKNSSARCSVIRQTRIENPMLNQRVLQQHNIEKSKSKRLNCRKITDDDFALTTQDRATAMLNLAYAVSKKRRIRSKSTSTIVKKLLTKRTNACATDNTRTIQQEPMQVNGNDNAQHQKKTLSQKQIAHNRMLLNILNRANIVQLQSLPSIGGKRAFSIYHYRELNGSFKSFEDLRNVPTWSKALWKKFLAVNNVVLEE